MLLLKSASALLPAAVLAIPIASIFLDWRIADGNHAIIAYALFGFGALVSIFNFYLSILRRPLWIARGRSPHEIRFVSGIPLLGRLVLAGLALAPASLVLSCASLLLVLADTGNIGWFIVAIWRDDSFWRAKQ
ncbi:MAG TPA: hypothetical protein VK843_18840 [Planctomycetota bacterium]|nr:hypothetical protein [Planctomycetota bacterium]